MLTAFESLLPVFGLIAIGAFLRRQNLLDDTQWRGVEDLVYYLCFPALIVHTLATADFAGVPVLAMAIAMAIAILAIAAILSLSKLLIVKALDMDGPAFASLYQGSTRWNTYVALAIAGSLYGRPGISLAAIGVAVMIPLVNILAVGAHLIYAREGPVSWSLVVRGLYTNPLIVACVIGIAINVSGIPIYAPILEAGSILGRATLGLGLLTVGAGLVFHEGMKVEGAVVLSAVAKLLGLPLFMYAGCIALGVTGLPLTIAMICASVPTATSAYVLARKLGGDAPLMARIVTVQTLLALLTLPAILALFHTG